MNSVTKVIGILGSTNTNGLTAQMLKAVLRGAEEQGCVTEMIHLSELSLKLTPSGEKNDILDALSDRLIAADCLVLASPTYWGDASGLMKNFLDCMRSKLLAFNQKGETMPGDFKGKGYVLLTSCYTKKRQNRWSGITDPTFTTMDKPLGTAGMNGLGEEVCTDTFGKTILPSSKEEDCIQLGRQIPKKLNKGGFTMKRYIQLFFMLAVTVLIVMGIQKGLSSLGIMSLTNFWLNYLVFVLLTYILLSGLLHYFAVKKHKR
ncbi:NADPH-dependent FMN reductase [Terrilactibacillus sp. BCM23-1]|uniref:NADPH-dependent FMN reductase n=1 Tax=Terrilactibacillus tamarindi TaxID=2599694 RepID=A0A6N8CQI7_9BACI|nr:NADPH-dependent FMN reductase [Terrilactibacillus tamarindi]